MVGAIASTVMRELIVPLVGYLDRKSPGDLIGLYGFGSAVSSGLRSDSDIDVLMLTRRPLTLPERAGLVDLLLDVSGWKGHAERFPEATHRRPIELTSLVTDDCRSWTRSPRRDFQYGEWLRDDLVRGSLPRPVHDPDVLPLIATAHAAHTIVRGPALAGLAPPVPDDLLRHAVRALLPSVVAEVEGDERNALLTIARMLVTLETGTIVSKDAAARAVAPTLGDSQRALLERARDGYLGTATDDWSGLTGQATALAHALARRAQP